MSDQLPTVYKYLNDFDIHGIEAKIYVFLVNREPQTVLQIAKSLNLPRTSIYDHIQVLIARSLVERIMKYKSQEFRAYPIDILENMIDQEKTRVEKLTDSLTALKNSLSAVADLFVPQTQVRYFHGASGIRQMMWNALSAKKENIGYSVMGRREVVGEKFLKRFLEEFGKRNLLDRVLINPVKETLTYVSDGNLSINGKLANFERIRSIDKDILTITGDTTIYNNIFSVMYWKKGEIVGVEIENPELVAMQKSMFEILWKLAKPVKSKEK